MSITSTTSRTQRERNAESALRRAEIALEEAREQFNKFKFPESPGKGEYRIEVRFERNGPIYTFLVLINGRGKVYTTAVAEGGSFESFEAFVEWLRGKDAFAVGNLRETMPAGQGIALV